jgi:type II secretory pathway component PulF
MRFGAAQKSHFYTEIAKLLEAGFGIREAARVMLDTRPPGVQAELLREMDRSLEQGGTIAEAFGRGSAAVGSLERGIIAAGERGGRLGPAFAHLADYFGMLGRARRDALAAMAYPAALLHAGIFVSVLVPELSGGDARIGGILLKFAAALVVLYLVWIVAAVGVRALLAAAARRADVDTLLSRVPVIGKARTALAMARFAKVYHTCLLAGLSMRETVDTAAAAAQSGAIRGAAEKLRAALDRGDALGPVFLQEDAFPAAFSRSYATAEESGGLDKDLARWADYYQEEAGRRVKTAAGVISKAVYFAVILYIAWTVISAHAARYGEMMEMLDE